MGALDGGSTAGLLIDARRPRTDPVAAERAVLRALAAAPSDFTAHLAAYKLYFYNHRLAEALPHAELLIGLIGRRLNIAADWRDVHAGDAAFGEPEEVPGLYLQALIAWGYCKARLGAGEDGRAAVAKAAELDPRDRFGARRLLRVIESNGHELDED